MVIVVKDLLQDAVKKQIKQIAILDDDTRNREDAEAMLNSGFRVASFESSEKLFDYLEVHDVNLLLVSAELTTGYFASVVTDTHERWPGLPVLLTCEGNGHSRTMQNNYSILSVGVVSRPFVEQELLGLVSKTIEDWPYSTCLANRTGE